MFIIERTSDLNEDVSSLPYCVSVLLDMCSGK